MWLGALLSTNGETNKRMNCGPRVIRLFVGYSLTENPVGKGNMIAAFFDLDGTLCKVTLLTELLAKSGLEVYLSQSFAYGDSIFDVPVLELVGNPVAVYPDSQLWDYASQREWRIIGEPKET